MLGIVLSPGISASKKFMLQRSLHNLIGYSLPHSKRVQDGYIIVY
jgi:hypothetical protein